MEALYNTIRSVIKQRSLVVFFTNYESLSSLQRQLPFLKRIAKFHLLLVVFFENTELKKLSEQPAEDVEGGLPIRVVLLLGGILQQIRNVCIIGYRYLACGRCRRHLYKNHCRKVCL